MPVLLGVALGEGVDRQHLNAREVRLEERLQSREHAIGLALLVADEADALAGQSGDSRGMRLLHRGDTRDPASRFR